MAGAAAADRECARAEDAKRGNAYQAGQGPSAAPSHAVEMETPEECERWLERLALSGIRARPGGSSGARLLVVTVATWASTGRRMAIAVVSAGGFG